MTPNSPSHLTKLFSSRLLTQAPLAPYTYMKIGGPAEFLLVVNSAAELKAAASAADKDGLPLTLLGSASNTIISDSGLAGLAIINRAQQIKVHSQTSSAVQLQVESGTLVNQLVHYTLKAKLSGCAEFLGLPGTVGGAVYNNAHSQTKLIGQMVDSVSFLDHQLQTKCCSQSQCRFSYDHSIFQTKPWLILSVIFNFKLVRSAKPLIASANQSLTHRTQTQPLNLPNSGCMFKNLSPAESKRYHLPPGVISAGWLIEQAGCKGMTQGGALVSPQHANFIVNQNQATAQDVVLLTNRVRNQVHDRFHLWLDREVFFLGDHPDLDLSKV